MLKPTSSEIQSYAADYSMIPLCREIYADVTTPIALLRRYPIGTVCWKA